MLDNPLFVPKLSTEDVSEEQEMSKLSAKQKERQERRFGRGLIIFGGVLFWVAIAAVLSPFVLAFWGLIILNPVVVAVAFSLGAYCTIVGFLLCIAGNAHLSIWMENDPMG